MTNKTILITRSMGDGDELREQLQEQGHHVIHEPLTEIFLKHTARQDLLQALQSDPDAIIVTSRYGVHALATLDELRDVPLLCVGEATAEVALSAGFTRTSVAGSTVDEMINYIADAYDAESSFIYASAEHIRTDIEPLLQGFNMHVQRIVLYEAVASEALSDTIIEQLKRQQIDGVTFFSKRSAETFMKLLDKAEIKEMTVDLEAYCLSDAVAEGLQNAQWKTIIISDEPTLASLIASVDNAQHDRANKP